MLGTARNSGNVAITRSDQLAPRDLHFVVLSSGTLTAISSPLLRLARSGRRGRENAVSSIICEGVRFREDRREGIPEKLERCMAGKIPNVTLDHEINPWDSGPTRITKTKVNAGTVLIREWRGVRHR